MNIWTISETYQGELSGASKECIGEAKRLSDSATVTTVILGGDDKSASSAGHFGADKVALLPMNAYHLENLVETLASAIEEHKPELVVIPASTHGKELSARLAARFKSALSTESLSLKHEDDNFKAVRPMYAGKVLVTVVLKGDGPRFATLRPNVVSPLQEDSSKTAETLEIASKESSISGAKLTQLEASSSEGGEVELTEANVVVAGGRGFGNKESFNLLIDLAKVLNAGIGSSRMVVDNGWLDYNTQIGQTGNVVTPNLYFAIGISGAIQHVVGMQNSGCIVAINNNPDAPIFKLSDYGVVADLFEVLPILTEKLKSYSLV